MLNGMAGSKLGVWVAHGEGRAYFPDETILKRVNQLGLVALRYVDDSGNQTMEYPFNPNGSTDAIAGNESRHKQEEETAYFTVPCIRF